MRLILLAAMAIPLAGCVFPGQFREFADEMRASVREQNDTIRSQQRGDITIEQMNEKLSAQRAAMAQDIQEFADTVSKQTQVAIDTGLRSAAEIGTGQPGAATASAIAALMAAASGYYAHRTNRSLRETDEWVAEIEKAKPPTG